MASPEKIEKSSRVIISFGVRKYVENTTRKIDKDVGDMGQQLTNPVFFLGTLLNRISKSSS